MIKRIFAFMLADGFVALLAVFLFVYMPYWFKNESYPTEYEDIVERYSEEYGIDKEFVFAVIRTESNFNPDAVSEAGAIGLMQIIEDSFDWVSKKLGREDLVFDDMFSPEYSIEYGCFMLGYLYNRFGSYELAAAAYHSGMGEVSSWIASGEVDAENPNINDFKGSNTRHYVNKIMRAYNKYSELEERNK